ncbi:MAG: DHH family phosphoesterase [Blautia sp.]
MKEKFKLKGQLKRFMQWPLFLTLLLCAVDVLVYFINMKAGFVLTLGILVYAVLAFILFFYNKPLIFKELVSFASSYDKVQQRMLDQMQMPYVILDTDGRILWKNQSFDQLAGIEHQHMKNIDGIFEELDFDRFPAGDGIVEIPAVYRERDYNVVLTRVSLADLVGETSWLEADTEIASVVTACFHDVTEINDYIRKNEEEKLIVALAYLDNYDEALESVEEVRRSLLVALIDRKINKYFAGIDGLVKKIEKDKYFLVMRQRSLDQLIAQKFHILEEVKSVNIGNEMAVTLSIGVGQSGSTYAQNYEYSRAAIEMALGRGGDQVVIKQGDKISYFGGKSQQMEKTTRVKARVKAQALKEFISTREQVVVMGHKITDVDAFGAAIGIYRAGKTLDKKVHIVINDPTSSIRPLMTGFMNSSEYESDMFVSSQEAKEIVDVNTVVVVVDTNKPSYTECEELLYKTKTIVVLDHHRRGSEVIQNAVLSYVEPYASSTCEMVAEVLQYFSDGIRIRSLEADSIYAGIMIDTNNFTAKAGVRTFEAAAFLRRCGADVTRVRKMLRDNMESYKARAEAIRTAEIYREVFAIATCPSDGLESPTVVGAQAANELLNIAGIKASFVLTPYNNVVYISARAMDEINVQVIMERLGGGGHMNIAGAQVPGYSTVETVKMLKGIINEMYKEGEL